VGSHGGDGTRRLVVHIPRFGTAAYVAIQAALDGRRNGMPVEFLDLTRFEPRYPSRATDGYIQSLIHRSSSRSPSALIRSFAEDHSFDHSYGINSEDACARPRVATLMDQVPEDFSDLLSWRPNGSDVGRYLANWLASEIAMESQPQVSRHMRAIRRELEAYVSVKSAVLRHLVNYSQRDQLCVWNGRRPSYHGAAEAAKHAGLEVLYLEGGRRGFFFIEKNRPHNRKQIATSANVLARHLGESQTLELCTEFSKAKREDVRANPFLYLIESGSTEPTRSVPQSTDRAPLVTIFTSSVDEVIGLETWENEFWPTQEEAVKHVAKCLQQFGYHVIIRIHPNLSQKSWREIRRIRAAYSDTDYHFVEAVGGENTYGLLARCDAVIVWRSTVGLEALIEGIPVWVLDKTRYDETGADVRFLRPDSICAERPLARYTPDVAGASMMLTYLTVGGSQRCSETPVGLHGQLSAFDEERGFGYPGRSIVRLIDGLWDLRRSPRSLVNASLRLGRGHKNLKWVRPLRAVALHVTAVGPGTGTQNL
jgi:hypothetical protein